MEDQEEATPSQPRTRRPWRRMLSRREGGPGRRASSWRLPPITQGELSAAPRLVAKRAARTHPDGVRGGGKKKVWVAPSGPVPRCAMPTTAGACTP